MKYEYYQTVAGVWRWRLKGANGEKIASGEGYKRKIDCLKVIDLIRGSGTATIFVLLLLIPGCAELAGYQKMTPEQIKATAGTITCSQVDLPLYGKASFIAMNADDTKKGATSASDVAVTCGQTTFTVKSTAGVPVPAGATTTTTTIVTPAK